MDAGHNTQTGGCIQRMGQALIYDWRNFWRLFERLKPLEESMELPRIEPMANPAPFGFPITVRKYVDRQALINHLEATKIETRLVSGGKILHELGFLNIARRVYGSLEASDRILRDTFFLGVFPGLGRAKINHMLEQIFAFFVAR